MVASVQAQSRVTNFEGSGAQKQGCVQDLILLCFSGSYFLPRREGCNSAGAGTNISEQNMQPGGDITWKLLE